MSTLGRRAFMGAAAGAAAVPSAVIAKPWAADRESLFTTAADHLKAYVRLVGSTAPEMLYTHYQGVLYGVIANDVPMPLVRFEALGKARWTPQPDGSYLRKSHDLGFFGDLRTRQPLDRWHNPYIKEDVRPLHYKNGRGETLYTTTGPRLPWGKDAKASDAGKSFAPDWTVSGDEIWVDDEVFGERESWLSPTQWPRASSGPRIYIRSTVVSKGFVSELTDATVSSARCTGMWTGLFPWLPWLHMGQRPGFLLWRSVGRKIRTPQEASPRILDFIARREPRYLIDEEPWLDRKNSWIDYAKSIDSARAR
jgi:hypothetical protein